MSLEVSTVNHQAPSEGDDSASSDAQNSRSPTSDVTQQSSVGNTKEDDLSAASSQEQKSPRDVETDHRNDISMTDNAFDSERSRVLFDVIDQFQSCGAGEFVDIPQLVIVGDQSTGKSSLLQSLTNIPFPVGTEICTRFATRIVSRRTAPGTPNQVKITIVPPDIKIEHFGYPLNRDLGEYVHVQESLTAEEFSDVMEEVTTKYMGINPGRGSNKKNFAVEVLKIEISGPTRSHFSILDIPGVFRLPYSVNDNEMSGVLSMVSEYMKQPENIVICIADAVSDLARQDIFTLASKYVDKARLVGVFTKCDLVPKTELARVVANAKGDVKGAEKLLPQCCFVVRNRAADEDADFDLESEETKLFSKPPWSQILEARRGSTKLKSYLGKLLCKKIEMAFPHLFAKLAELLYAAKDSVSKLGESRTTQSLRRAYLANIAQKYEESARDALERPWSLSRLDARARSLVREENDKFGARMREFGHVYEFQDHNEKEEEYMQRLKGLLCPELIQEPKAPGQAEHVTKASTTRQRHQQVGAAVRSSEALFAKIRDEVSICGCTELPGLVHPDIIRRLYREQTDKWREMAEDHLRAIAAGVVSAMHSILDGVCPAGGGTGILHEELLLVLRRFYDGALRRALAALRTYCDGDRTKLLQTTDPLFSHRLRLLQSLRLVRSLAQAIDLVRNQNQYHSFEDLELAVFNDCHHSTPDNTVNEVHDALKVYYEFSLQSFIRHINNTIVEDFLMDPEGPLKGLSMGYIYGLPAEDVDRLGRESREVIEERERFEIRIKTLVAAESAARTAMARTSSLD